MDAFDKVKKYAGGLKKTYDEGQKETSGMGAELSARASMNRSGEDALKGPTTAPTEEKPVASKPDPAGAYGTRKGEQRIDTSSMTKPLGSYEKGTNHVPKTGIYKLHEGEKVVPANENPDNLNKLDEEKPMEKETTDKNHTPEEKAHFQRAMSHMHKGGLHDHFNMKHDEPIPMAKKQEAANSDNPHTAAMGRMAVAMHGWSHKGSK
jgi:hypothetical protein